ncbi:hypothetical protein F4806DRAFT_507802 [Annulohypoxylon nitens]|nr:hypothetical protein F4806DRAFT_507802 [Annulohypoxylon nitens]
MNGDKWTGNQSWFLGIDARLDSFDFTRISLSDMAITASHDPAIICAERIAALHFLHHVPVDPSSNPVTTVQSRSVGYTLPFEKERDLASTLAFLALFKDDNNHIPAICIEEDPDAAYINVLLAVNKLRYDSGQQMLADLKNSFDEIFSLLDQDYVKKSRPSDILHPSTDGIGLAAASRIESEIFKAIVSMCRERILHRLRLEGRLAQKQSIKKALQKAFDYLRHVESWKMGKQGLLSTLTLFIEKAREVLQLSDSWINHPRDAELENLVEGIYHLWQVNHLETLIKEIPENAMQSNLRDSLINMISKVSRYRESARFLYRLGKKVPLARKMRTVIVEWTSPNFARSDTNQYLPSLNATVSLVEGLKNRERDLEHICRLLNSEEKNSNRRLNQKEASDQFAAQACKTLREAKIHAEIQLLYHCDAHIPHTRLPRVVCSSKDACWLCNEFILLYEKIHTPKSHGRIYPGWRVPVVGRDELAKRYNGRLQGTLRDSLKTLFARKKRSEYPYPNESTLLALYLSDSTLSSVDLPLRDKKAEAAEEAREEVPPNGEEATAEVDEVEDVEQVDVTELANEVMEIGEVEEVEEAEGEEKTWDSGEESDQMDIYSSSMEDLWIASLEARAPGSRELWAQLEEARKIEEVGKVPQDTNDEEDAAPIAPDDQKDDDSHDAHEFTERWSSGRSSSSSEGSLTLKLGETRSKKIWKGKSTPLYNAGPLLDIQVKYATSKDPETPNTPHNLHKKLSYSLQRLKPEEAHKLRSGGGVPINGADLPTGHWVDGNTDGDGCVYIANGGEVMKLLLRPILE